MTTYYIKSGSGVTQFAQSTAYASGDRIVPVRSDTGSNYRNARQWVWECTTPGTTAAANPTWPASVTQDVTTVTSGGATFTARRPGFSSGSTANWTFAAIFFDYLFNGTGIYGPNGDADVVYVSGNHAESVAATITLDFIGSQASFTRVLCVDDSSAPPSALATTAVVQTTGVNSLILDHYAYIYGVTFKSASYIDYVTGSYIILDHCGMWLTGSGSADRIMVHAISSFYCRQEWRQVDVKFANTGQGIGLTQAEAFVWRGGSILAGSSAITSLLKDESGGVSFSYAYLDGLDLSNAATAFNFCVGSGYIGLIARNCKMPASWSGGYGGGAPTNFIWGPAGRNEGFGLFNIDSGDTNYRFIYPGAFGQTISETTLVRTGGASDGTTPISWKMVATAAAAFPVKTLYSQEIEWWNDVVGSAITLTAEILHDSATNLTDDEVWIEVGYLGNSGSAQSKFLTDAKGAGTGKEWGDPLASAADQTASSATWTTTGMSNPNKQKLAVTITPQEKGPIICKVALAKASKTIYVDPLVTIS